jgi:hypothetical protein
MVALPRESTDLRRCSCQALNPSERLRLYEYFEPILATSAVANGEADLELNDMQILPMLPEGLRGSAKIVRRRASA